jgi:Gene product 88
MQLLTKGDSSPKIAKSNDAGLGYYSGILYLAPHKLSGYNTCASASDACIAACLNLSGRGRMNSVQQARIARTKYFFEDRTKFIDQLYDEVDAFVRRCNKLKLKPALRLNGTSDIMWEQVVPKLHSDFPNVQWYDYTKIYNRMLRFIHGEFPSNYHLTFSLSEVNFDKSLDVLKRGGNVAVVFRNKDIGPGWLGYKVHNADKTDLRFLDPHGWQGLYAKGKAKYDRSGFVVEN